MCSTFFNGYGLIDKTRDISLRYKTENLTFILCEYLETLYSNLRMLEYFGLKKSLSSKLNKYFETNYIIEFSSDGIHEIIHNVIKYDFSIKNLTGLMNDFDILIDKVIIEKLNKIKIIINSIQMCNNNKLIVPPNVIIREGAIDDNKIIVDDEIITKCEEKKIKIKELEQKITQINSETLDDLCDISYRKRELTRLREKELEKKRVYESDVNIYKKLIKDKIQPPTIFKNKYDIFMFMDLENLLDTETSYDTFLKLYDKLISSNNDDNDNDANNDNDDNDDKDDKDNNMARDDNYDKDNDEANDDNDDNDDKDDDKDDKNDNINNNDDIISNKQIILELFDKIENYIV